MKTQCSQRSFGFYALGAREVVGRFDGGQITSDGGGLLLRETKQATGIIAQFAGCFIDHRDPDLIEHTVEELVAQRIYALALGYEDLNALRRLGLNGTDLAKAQCGTIRLKLLKIGAQIRMTVRKVWVSLAESYPYREVFHQVYERLRRLCPTPLRC